MIYFPSKMVIAWLLKKGFILFLKFRSLWVNFSSMHRDLPGQSTLSHCTGTFSHTQPTQWRILRKWSSRCH